ncbi:MAG: divalent metal cation transporter [Planctomycetia bacterium]|nr:divalent metal cation transporter [Planctomycetia bacterium]
MNSFLQKFLRFLLLVGPGIFCVGYTIGTGSVTTIITAGSKFGMNLLWIVIASSLFCGVLMEAFGRFALVTGETSIHAFRKYFGAPVAILAAFMVILGQWFCLSGLVGLSSEAIYQMANIFFPATAEIDRYWFVLGTAACVMATVYAILWVGNYSRIEFILTLLVSFLGLSFIVSNFYVHPELSQLASGLIPGTSVFYENRKFSMDSALLAAALVGTTLAAPTFVVRPLLLHGKGWTIENLKEQSKDVYFSTFLMFVINAAIMACACGAIFNRGGEPIQKVMDMVQTLQPIAGSGAVLLFLIGLTAAGLSSIFPIVMVAPLLIGDYKKGELQMKTSIFRIITAFVCCLGLMVPLLGANPIVAQILTQIAQVFVLPLVILLMMILVNRRSVMGEYRVGILLNVGMLASFLFSLVISAIAVRGLIQLLS